MQDETGRTSEWMVWHPKLLCHLLALRPDISALGALAPHLSNELMMAAPPPYSPAAAPGLWSWSN